MYSPTRENGFNPLLSPHRNPNTAPKDVSSPLRSLATPFVEAVKTAQSNATEDFENFYGNLMARLTPKTSQNRVRKMTPDVTDRMKTMLQQRKNEINEHNGNHNQTSLTPLIERHSLREDPRTKYDYASRNPFYTESESSDVSTPGLQYMDEEEEEEEEEMTEEMEQDITHYNKPALSFNQRLKTTRQKDESHNNNSSSSIANSPRKSLLAKTRSNISNNSSKNTKLIDMLFEEEKRMDRLQSNMAKIKRQSSFLSEGSCSNDFFEDEEVATTETRPMEQGFSYYHKSSKKPTAMVEESRHRQSSTFKRQAPTPQTETRHSNFQHQLATPPHSIEYSAATRSKPLLNTATPNKSSLSPHRNAHSSRKNTSPKRTVIADLPNVRLRSTELVSTPGGSMVSNRFWKEIHGLQSSPSSSHSAGRVTKRIKTNSPRHHSNITTEQQQEQQQHSRTTTADSSSSNHTWANDDLFWSAESSNAKNSSSLNHKLFQAAQEERQQQQYQTLSEELDLANDKQRKERKNQKLPTINPDLLNELKAKHHQASFIDDSDSYKFNA